MSVPRLRPSPAGWQPTDPVGDRDLTQLVCSLRLAAPDAGIVLSTWLQYAAWEERAHPVAVVIAPTLSVERGPDEPSRPAVLLAAGERVRLGEVRGGQVEVRLGANRIGWAAREGLWRVADATRYTPKFQPR